MDIIPYFVQNYMLTAVAACAFLIFIRFDCAESDRTTRNFFRSTTCILFLVFIETAEHYCAEMENNPGIIRVLLSAVGYSVRPAIAYFVAIIPIREQKLHTFWYLSIPLVFNALVVFSAIGTDLVFYYDANNDFHRGVLGYVPFVISVYYFVVLVVLAWHRTRRGERQEAVICTCTVIGCAVCVVLESHFGFIGKLPAIALLGEIYYFMHLLMTRYSVDRLTSAYVRKHLYRDVEARSIARYFITFDVNGLKRINDKYGHAAGDRALIGFADSVRMCLPAAATFYRLGGDEFAIIYRTTSTKEVEKLISLITSLSKNLPYGVSSGYASFIDGTDFDDASARADAMLYANKNAFWKKYAQEHPDDMDVSLSRRRTAE